MNTSTKESDENTDMPVSISNDINDEVDLEDSFNNFTLPGDNESSEVDYDIEQGELYNIIKKFKKKENEYYKEVLADFEMYKQNPKRRLAKVFKNKYPHLKRYKKRIQGNTKEKQIQKHKAYVWEILSYYNCVFNKEELTILYTYLANKIQGVFKHTQALKTGFCNLMIINSNSEPDTMSVCITKNTLEANSQWLERIFNDLKERFPNKDLKNLLMIVSSKKNTLNDENGKATATHCKNLSSAWLELSKKNNFKIVFLCSNKTRITDISELCELFNNLNPKLRKRLRILHDEAHNAKEGIPAYRHIIEYILCQEIVLSYHPITASNIPLSHPDNPLWNKDNLENNAIDYREYNKIKSTSEEYSAICDAKKITIEDLKKKNTWENFEVTKIPKEIFRKVEKAAINLYDNSNGKKIKRAVEKECRLYKTQGIVSQKINIDEIKTNIDTYSREELLELYKKIYIERKRTLEFCGFMKSDKEIKAVNRGLNVLNMNELIQKEYFKPNNFNLHIISTPKRNIITKYLAEEAVKKDFNPIVFAIYGNKGDNYHLHYDGQEEEVSEIMGEGQFNDKLYRLLEYLKEEGINIERPFIIMGNYTPTGESLSYVHYKYGTLRGNIRLISTNADEDYQQGSRGNYMKTKFKKEIPDWKEPEKYLVGSEQFHRNCKLYEQANDERIDNFETKSEDDIGIRIHLKDIISNSDNTGTVAIPIKITIGDFEHPKVQELVNIQRIPKKNTEHKKKFLQLLKECVENEEIDIEMDDKEGKFNFNTFILKDFRKYEKKNEPKKGEWKFINYKNHYDMGTGFINNTSAHVKNQCEMCTCVKHYTLKDESGITIERNFRKTWWMGYKY